MKTIFEALDVTDEEMYFTVGLWPTLEEAIAAIEAIKDPDECSEQYHEEFGKVDIRERAIGFSDFGVKRAEIEWESKQSDNDEEYWERKPTVIIAAKL